jgi:molybdopterin molybdotransferase
MDHPGHVHAVEDLVPLEDVQELVLSRCSPLGAVDVPVAEAAGAVLAGDVVVEEPIPPFANTAMDGYAVRSADVVTAPVELRVLGVMAAGAAPPASALGAGETWQIMTGAPMPPGADAVAIVERTERLEDGRVRVLDSAGPGANVRPAGSDYQVGTLALAAGTLLTPAHLGVLASVGRATVSVWRRPVVGVMSTGDELVEAGAALQPGQIRDSNRVTLGAFVRAAGFPVVDLGCVRDTKEALEAALLGALDRCDVVLSSGGVSKGEFDFVKVVLDRLATQAAGEGGEAFELGVSIRPAKPLALAWLPRSGRADLAGGTSSPAVFFGLPGNPVSAVVSYLVVALPAMRKMAGWSDPLPRSVAAVALDQLRAASDGRLNLLRVSASVGRDGRLAVRSAGGQQSHQLSGLTAANALAVVPSGATVEAGDVVDVIPFGPLA